MSSSDLPPVIAALLDPSCYSHDVERVDLIQTHISYVLLAGAYVYKIKKPVDFGFLNFSTLPRRRYYCHQEVTLNERLCPGVYLAVVPVTDDGKRIRLGERRQGAAIIEYTVRMQRLPSERMMDHLLETGEVTVEMVERLADRIAAFHEKSERSPRIDRYGSPRVIARNWRENFEQIGPFVGICLSPWQYELLQEYVASFLQRNRPLLLSRVRDGHIRDCHGDLRTSAVCFIDDICVYDCIEFNHRFRYSDVASEVAFLAMDLDRRGHHALSTAFVRRYAEQSQDSALTALLDFYCCYRAFVRGKVAAFRLSQPEVSDAERAESARIAAQAFDMAVGYAARQRPALFVTCGLSGSGKSVLAGRIASARGMHLIASDRVRKELKGIATNAHPREGYCSGIYAPSVSARTYSTMFERARALLERGEDVVLDATFMRRADRAQALALASETGAAFACLECIAPEATIVERLIARESDLFEVSDARVDTFRRQQLSFEPVTELPERMHVVVDMSCDVDTAVDFTLNNVEQRIHPMSSRAADPQ